MKGGAIIKSGFKRVHLTVLSEHTVTLSIAGRNEIHIQHSQQVSLFSSHCTKCSDSRTMKSLALVIRQFVCAFFFFFKFQKITIRKQISIHVFMRFWN